MNQNSKSRNLNSQFDSSPGGQWSTFLIALLLTLLLHVGLFIILPDDLLMRARDSDSSKDETIELTLERVDPERLRYVEANPEAPKNEPDRKDAYSFRAQQSADENPETSRDNSPQVDGSEATQKIVQGTVEQQESILQEGGVFKRSEESKEHPDESSRATQAARWAPAPPAPNFIQQKPESEEGPGSRLQVPGPGKQIRDEYSDDNQPIQLYRTDSENQQNQESTQVSRSAEARPLPRKRLSLPPDLVQGPLMRSKGSASRRGTIAIDATFSQFGEYEKQFYAAVQAGWYQEIDFFQPIDTSARVVVQFRIRADGTVDDVTVLSTTASEIATLICQTALTKRSPFRPWTEEMVQVFGRERVMKVAFSYL